MRTNPGSCAKLAVSERTQSSSRKAQSFNLLFSMLLKKGGVEVSKLTKLQGFPFLFVDQHHRHAADRSALQSTIQRAHEAFEVESKR